jgi:hypothetical protein
MVLFCRTIQIRHDTRWRDGCEAAGVTVRVVVCNAWLGSVFMTVIILSTHRITKIITRNLLWPCFQCLPFPVKELYCDLVIRFLMGRLDFFFFLKMKRLQISYFGAMLALQARYIIRIFFPEIFRIDGGNNNGDESDRKNRKNSSGCALADDAIRLATSYRDRNRDDDEQAVENNKKLTVCGHGLSLPNVLDQTCLCLARQVRSSWRDKHRHCL